MTLKVSNVQQKSAEIAAILHDRLPRFVDLARLSWVDDSICNSTLEYHAAINFKP